MVDGLIFVIPISCCCPVSSCQALADSDTDNEHDAVATDMMSRVAEQALLKGVRLQMIWMMCNIIVQYRFMPIKH